MTLEVLNVGRCLTHGDGALDSDAVFVLLSETRLIPARVRNECAKLWAAQIASARSQACQASAHVGSGVGLVSIGGALVSLPSIGHILADWEEPTCSYSG